MAWYRYTVWVSLFFVLPLAVLGLRHPHTVKRHLPVIGFAAFGSMVIAIPWDLLALHDGVWVFNHAAVTGFYLAGIPVDELAWFVLYPALVATLTVIFYTREVGR